MGSRSGRIILFRIHSPVEKWCSPKKGCPAITRTSVRMWRGLSSSPGLTFLTLIQLSSKVPSDPLPAYTVFPSERLGIEILKEKLSQKYSEFSQKSEGFFKAGLFFDLNIFFRPSILAMWPSYVVLLPASRPFSINDFKIQRLAASDCLPFCFLNNFSIINSINAIKKL